MSQSKNTKSDERSVEEYKVLDEVYNANWRDDVDVEAKEEDKIKKEFEFYDNESSYDSSKNKEIDITRLKRFGAAHRQSRLIGGAIKAVLKTV